MRFAIKGVFQFETHFAAATRQRERLYEARVINLEAETEAEAVRQALTIFGEDEWEAKQPATHIEYQEQRFLGLSQIRDLEFMESYEVWYEYLDECPTVLVKP